MRKRPTVFLITFLFLFLPIFSVSAYDAKTTHFNLTEITVDFYNQQFSNRALNETEKQLLMQGSIDEDNGIRSINHFYDPVYNKTWQFGGVEYLFSALTAKEWGQNPFTQAMYDPLYAASLGLIVKSPVFSAANFTWQKAIYEYVKGNKPEAFKALGHILHLIQDMSVPEHTRENVHIFFIESANSPYELYTAKSNKDFYEQTQKNIQSLKPIKKLTLNEYFDETALYSNNYFYSPDTVSGSEYKLPQPVFTEVPELRNGKLIFYVLGEDENHDIFHLALILKNNIGWRLTSGPTIYSLEDDQILQDYWQRLSKKAALSGAGMIDLFFQEAEKAKSDPNFLSKNEQNILTAALNGVNTFFNNVFQKNNDYVLVDNSPITNSTTSSNSNTNSSQISPITLSTTITIPKKITTTLKPTTTTIKSTTTTLKPTTTTLKQTTTTTLKATTTTTLKTNLCSFSTSQFPLRNKIIINEVAWMGTQNSSNDEWIELKNIFQNNIDLSGWQILDKDNQIKIVFEDGTKLNPNQFLLLERTSDDSVPNISANYIYVGALSNSNEGLRLFDNNCNLMDEVLANPDWLAGDNTSKRTMERKTDLTWQTSLNSLGTPKAENSSGYVVVVASGGSNTTTSSQTTTTTTVTSTTTTTTTTKPNYQKILITEIKVAGLSSDGKTNVYDEFIELFNPSDEDINLTSWYLQKKTSQVEEFSSLVPSSLLEGKSIASNGYLLIAHSSSTYTQIADILISDYSVTATNTIALKNPNREIVDKVGFGEANDCEVNCAINPEPGQSIQRKYLDGNFLDSDNNLNDFEIQDCPSPKTLFNNCLPGETTTTTTTTRPPITSTPAIPYITEFFWHPFDKSSSKIVIDFRTNSYYPFISSNVFTAMAFYLHSDNDSASSTFGIPLDYLGDKYNWELGGNTPGLKLSYPTYVSGTSKVGSIIFTSDGNMAANSAVPRKYSYQTDQLPKDNHFVVDVTGITNGQSLNFTADQYVTIGYYGYAGSYLKLIAYDNTKFYFDSSNYYHQPTNVENFEAKCDNEACNNLIFSWTPASDEDLKDTLKYDLHYVFAEQGDNLSNNNLTRQSWEWSSSQNVSGESTFNAQENQFHLQVPINNLYYIKAKRLPGVPLDVFFGIKAQDNEGLKSEIPKIIFLHISPIVP